MRAEYHKGVDGVLKLWLLKVKSGQVINKFSVFYRQSKT